MIAEISLMAASFVTGLIIPKVLGFHKCKYAIVHHASLEDFHVNVSYGRSSTEEYLGQKYSNEKTFLTCKECTICKKRVLHISDGTNRKFIYDEELIFIRLDTHMKKKKEKEEQEMLDRMEERSKTPEQKIKEAELEILERNAVMEAEKAKAEADKVKELARIEEIKLKQAEVKKQQDEIEMKRHEQREAKFQRELNKAHMDAMKAPGDGDIIYIAHKTSDSEETDRKGRKKGRIRA